LSNTGWQGGLVAVLSVKNCERGFGT